MKIAPRWQPTQHVERTIDLNEWLTGNRVATFIVRAEGDSMTGEIHSGDRLIVDRSLEARHRDVVVACLDGEMIVKRLLVRAADIIYSLRTLRTR